jgi:hypothetical protein
MTRKHTDRLNFYGSVTHVRGHTIIQPESQGLKNRNFPLVLGGKNRNKPLCPNAVKLETWKLSSMPTLFLLNFIKIIKLF